MDKPPPANTDEDWRTWSKEELSHQFSPSQWSPLTPPATIIGAYCEQALGGMREAKRTTPWRAVTVDKWDASDTDLEMDVYGEDLPKCSPIFVFVHGGYWQDLSRFLVGGLMGPLYNAATLTVTLSYTLAPTGNISSMVREVARGIAACHHLAVGRGATCLILAGWSAGAQLVTQAVASEEIVEIFHNTTKLTTINSEESSPPLLRCAPHVAASPSVSHQRVPSRRAGIELFRGLMCISGVFDLRPLVETYVNEPLRLDNDAAWHLSPANPRNLSNLRTSLPKSVRILVTTAEHDSPAFKDQANRYAKALGDVGFSSVNRLSVPGTDHFTIVSDLSDDTKISTVQLVEFVKECIQGW